MKTELLERARRDVPLAPMTTLRIGGPARLFLEIDDEAELARAVAYADGEGIPVLILGGGSNMLVSDSGFDGLVIRNRIGGVEIEPVSESISRVTAGAGVDWDELVAITVGRSLAGFECLSGIPGDVGATPIQNVGAYGQEIGDTLAAVQAFDRQLERFVELTPEECELGYRDSRFKSRERDRFVITRVSWDLRRDGRPTIRYPDLERELAERGSGDPSLADVRRAVLSVRASKGMVLDETDPDTRSAGSFFTNPIISADEHDRFLEVVCQKGLENQLRTFELEDGSFKLSAAWLIDHSGFEKGHQHGEVGLSSKHILAIINRGNGTAREVRELAAEIQKRVRDVFGISIVPEPNFIGDHNS